MDYAKLASQLGGAPIEDQPPKTPDYASLASQFGGSAVETKKPEESNSIWTDAADFAK